MHESSLAKRLVELVVARALDEGAARVVSARGTIAFPGALEPGTFALLFEAHARGTIAEGARLELEATRVGARCRACAREFDVEDHHVIVCPACGGLETELAGECGVRLEEVVVA